MEGLLEFRILAIIRQREAYLKYKDHIRLELFRSPELQAIYKTIASYHSKYTHAVISNRNLRMLIERKVSEDDLPTYIPILRNIRKSNITVGDEKVIHDCVVKFAQGQAIRQVASDIIYLLEHDPDELDLTEIRSRIDSAISLESRSGDSEHSFFEDSSDSFHSDREPLRIPTKIHPDLDRSIGGGLASGELGFILAPTGRGKTMALVNIGAGCLFLGKRVLHVTLEIKARPLFRRYSCRLTKRSWEELRDSKEEHDRKLEELRSRGAYLLIKDFSYTNCSLADIENILIRYKTKNEPFDLLIVDYADLLQPPKGYKEKRNELSSIYTQLRVLSGAYNIPVWTASQTNRAALDKRVVSLRDIAEDIGKANVSDVVLALCQTPEEKEENMMRIFVAKQRSSSKNPTVSIISDPDTMTMKGMRKDEGPDSDRSGTNTNWDRAFKKPR